MEIHLVKENHHDANCNEDGSPEQSICVENSEICNVFGDPEVSPRVGEEYQVEVPPLALKLHINLLQSSEAAEIQDGGSHDFLMGLAVPVMWISGELNFLKDKLKEPGDASVEICYKDEFSKAELKDTQIVLENDDAKPHVEAREMTVNGRIKVGEVAELALQKETNAVMHRNNDIDSYYLVPGVLDDPWGNSEQDSFLLGLYIFGKNLVLVKKFVGSKEMGDILSFYYGKFYRSEKYCRWSECRKARGRKCIYGQRLFKGWRQQELVSRLVLHASEESKNALIEVSKAFGDGKISLEEYVFALKATVGLEAFVEAVGIGKGKQDLTGISMEPLKSNHVLSVRPEIPIGKACSSLTPLEIVNYLTGDFRLSKARSSDLFWEAVWPRLLARGWHSEQPNNGFTAGAKHSLVFLVPGIKKFSRRKLVRGNHYFDSVSDVLGKVALDPGLLELDNNADKGCKSREENGWTDDSKLDQEDFPYQQRHCYLKPRTPAHNTDIVKFTIVDTSMAKGSAVNVRELRSLPVDLLSNSSSRFYSENNVPSSSNESMEESDSEENLHFDKDSADTSQDSRRSKEQRVYFNGNYFPPNASNQVFPANQPDSTDSPAEISKENKTVAFDGTHPRNAIVHQFSQKVRSENKKRLASVTKRRRRLNTFGSKTTINIVIAPKLKEEDACCSKDYPVTSEIFLPRADPSQEKSSSSSGGSPITSLDGNPITGGSPIIQSCGLIDLNLPIPTDAEIDEPVSMEIRKGQPDETGKELDYPSVVKSSDVLVMSDQQLHMNSRRLSSRNRPPTARALEARALGLLDVKQKRKNKDVFPEGQSMIRPPRRARPKVRPTDNLGISVADFKIEDRAVSTCNSNSKVFSPTLNFNS